MKTNHRVILCLCLCLAAFWSATNAFTQSTGDFVADEFASVSSTSFRSTGKRSELGQPLFSISLNLFGSSKNIMLEVKPVEDDMISPNCMWSQVHGTTVIESHPCPRPEAYEGVGHNKYEIFLSYLDNNRTLLKGFFTLAGERFFIDPSFEHASTLRLMDKLSLVKGPMIIYREDETQASKLDFPWNSTLANGQKKRALRQAVGPAVTPIAYPGGPFGSGQCTMKKVIRIKWHLDHSFVNRWNAEFANARTNAFQNPFPNTGSDWQAWSTRAQWVAVNVNAISKFVYERSVGIKMILDGVDEHPTPNDGADWNQGGTSSGGRYNCPYDINTMLDQYTQWCNGDGASRCLPGSSGSLNHLMSDCQRLYPGESGTVGLAWVGVICSTSNTGTCTFLGGRGTYQCSAHEMGHNFGAPHDFRSGNQDIMSYASTQYDGFSDQTYGKICNHLATRGYRCLKDDTGTTPTCTPQCNGVQCGSDGCGGQCGTCKIGQACTSGVCVSQCAPKCTGRQCGDNGCGGNCGICQTGFGCSQGICISLTPTCTPNCAGKGCGVSDGCGGICGKGCDVSQFSQGYTCSAATGFKCVAPAPPPTCTPSCTGKLCGSNGCGGSCGTCGSGAVCNTNTFQCVCAPITSCAAQKKTCGTLFNGCGTETCGPACTTTCTPNPNACAGRTCGFVSDGCNTIQCGQCSSSQTCVQNKCVVSNVCASCSPNADCGTGKCVCRGGYTGDGFTCVLANPVTPPTQSISWVADFGSAGDWSMSDEGNMLSNDNPSEDPAAPSLLRWKDSKQLLQGSTSITVTVMLRLGSLQSVGGLAFVTPSKGYAAVAVSGTRLMVRSGAPGDVGRNLQLGNVGSYDSTKWNNLTLVISRPDSSSTILKTIYNGQTFPPNCNAGCAGYSTSTLFTSNSDLTNGDIGFFNLGDVSDFSNLRVASKTKVVVTLGACFTDNNALLDNLSNLMNVDPSLINDLDNPCSRSGKRSIEEAGAVVSFTVSGATELSSSAVGPSIMAAELETGGVLASSAGATLGVSSVVTIPAAVPAAVAPAAAASSGLSAGAIAGIVVGVVAGAALVAGGAYVAVKKMSDDSSSSSASSAHKEKSMVLFQDAPKNDGPSKPKGGIDVLTNTGSSGHTSITARGVPISK